MITGVDKIYGKHYENKDIGGLGEAFSCGLNDAFRGDSRNARTEFGGKDISIDQMTEAEIHAYNLGYTFNNTLEDFDASKFVETARHFRAAATLIKTNVN